MQDHYGILGISAGATAAEVKKAYRMLALRYHPDRARNESSLGEARFREVQEAYDILGNGTRRARYDEERWLSGMDSRSRHAVPNTPEGIRNEIISVCRSLDGLDTHRLDKAVLGAYFRHLLRPARMETLLEDEAAGNRKEIIEAVLRRGRLLFPEDYVIVGRLLRQLAGSHGEMLALINEHAAAYRRDRRLKAWQPYLLLLLALLICGLMLLYGKRS